MCVKHCHVIECSQVITVRMTSSLVAMEGAFLIMIGVMAIMTVEITVMKMDVSNGRWEEILFKALILEQSQMFYNENTIVLNP